MGVLILDDDAGIGCANWALRAIVADVVPVLTRHGAVDLAAWLSSEVSPVDLYGDLDLRDLTPSNARAFRAAVGPACAEARERGPSDWADSKPWQGYTGLFQSLADQVSQLARGEKPSSLPNLRGVPPHDGSRAGPGWPNET